MIGITILAVALLVALGIAFYLNSIQKVWMLVPVNMDKPLPTQDDLPRFKFLPNYIAIQKNQFPHWK